MAALLLLLLLPVVARADGGGGYGYGASNGYGDFSTSNSANGGGGQQGGEGSKGISLPTTGDLACSPPHASRVCPKLYTPGTCDHLREECAKRKLGNLLCASTSSEGLDGKGTYACSDCSEGEVVVGGERVSDTTKLTFFFGWVAVAVVTQLVFRVFTDAYAYDDNPFDCSLLLSPLELARWWLKGELDDGEGEHRSLVRLVFEEVEILGNMVGASILTLYMLVLSLKMMMGEQKELLAVKFDNADEWIAPLFSPKFMQVSFFVRFYFWMSTLAVTFTATFIFVPTKHAVIKNFMCFVIPGGGTTEWVQDDLSDILGNAMETLESGLDDAQSEDDSPGLFDSDTLLTFCLGLMFSKFITEGFTNWFAGSSGKLALIFSFCFFLFCAFVIFPITFLSTYSSNEVIDMAIIIWVGGHVFLYALALGTIESVIKVVVLYIASLCLNVVDKPAIIGKGNRVSPLF